MEISQFRGDEDENYFTKNLRLGKETQSINKKQIKEVRILGIEKESME